MCSLKNGLHIFFPFFLASTSVSQKLHFSKVNTLPPGKEEEEEPVNYRLVLHSVLFSADFYYSLEKSVVVLFSVEVLFLRQFGG